MRNSYNNWIAELGKNHNRKPKLSRFAGLEIKRLILHYQKMSTSLLEYQQELESKVAERTEELNRIAKLDPLTELYNRRGFEAHMCEYMAHWQATQQPFGLINVDINRFKDINDQYGHAIGDHVLQDVAAYLHAIVKGKGEVARWGGDEFLILVKQSNDKVVQQITERLLDDLESLVINIQDHDVTIEFSVGSALVQEGDTLEKLLHRADKAMYAVKFAER